MKILYISGGGSCDYQCDSLFHGFRELFGEDVVDVNKLSFMYRGFDTSKLYGKGFTLYGLLDDLPVDRTEIGEKLSARYFDLVVFASVQREMSMYGAVADHYPPGKIVFIDGEDNPIFVADLVKRAWYFKRELHSPQDRVYPIQFGIPEEKIQDVCEKSKLLASLDPLDTRTYIYGDEQSYYRDYGISLFGKTMKKAGWECMRHLEIMACNCIPYFVNLEHCPSTIMTRSPKKEMLIAKNLLEYNPDMFETSWGLDMWRHLMRKIAANLREKLTTKALATYVLDTIGA